MLARAPDIDAAYVAGRYRIEAELGRGGMAAVYQAEDTVAHRRVALKRLLDPSKHKVSAFQREFYTLAGLRHQGIVEVYDYGCDELGPFYTMELLAGSDLRHAAPMPYLEVCRCLRETAAILALLHARRLVHGDVTPRNLWRTADGQVKLIDFGSLSPFGLSRSVLGTPPFVPPELLQGQPIDQGTDIYALGALGYWLLTGVHAYPARAIADLRELWAHRPLPPSEQLRKYRPELAALPGELDLLILACLSADPSARPPHVAEVIERLSVISGLPSVADASGAEGYLLSKAFVGREWERELVKADREKIRKTGQGACFVFECAPGMGASRLLGQLALEARLGGATTLLVSAQSEEEAFGAAHQLALRLLDTQPQAALKAAQSYAPILAHLSPELHQRLGSEVALGMLAGEAGERRMRMHGALRDWFLSLAREHMLCILVDDAHGIDDESAAFFASLAEEAPRYRLMVIASVRLDGTRSAAVQALCARAKLMRLYKLELHEMEELVRSIFGQVPHVSSLAERLHTLSQGNPGYCLELLQHLLRTNVLRHEQGMWLLPAQLSESDLPKSRHDALLARLDRLTEPARTLARVLSVHRGRLSSELCLLVSQEPTAATFKLLRTLVDAGVLLQTDDGYAFAHEAQRETLQQELTPELRRDVHLRLGRALADTAGPDHVRAVRAALHLLEADEPQRAGKLVFDACHFFVVEDKSAISSVVAEMEELVQLLRARGAGPYELFAPLAALCVAGTYVDRRLGLTYGQESMDGASHVLRLSLARKLRWLLGAKLALIVALVVAGVSLLRRRNNPLVPSLQDAIVLTSVKTPCLVGLHTMLIDPDGAERYTRMIEPLAALGEDHVTYLNHQVCLGFAMTNRDQLGDLIAHWERVVPLIEGGRVFRGLAEASRQHMLAGALLSWGSKEAWRDGQGALKMADKLDKLGLKLYEMSANQLRFMYYAYQGQPILAEHFRKRVEIAAIQRGAGWQVELWIQGESTLLARRTHDITLCKRAIDALERMAHDVPSIDIELRRTRGCHLVLRGHYEEGRAFIENMPEKDVRRVGWTVMCEMLARAYNGLGQHDKARDVCLHALARLTPRDLTFVVSSLGVQLELAMAYAGLGEHQRASADLDALLAQHGPKQGPLTLFSIHEARALVALVAGDDAACRKHIEQMEHWAMPTGIPSIMARSQRVALTLAAKKRRIANLGLGPAQLEGDEQLTARVEQLMAKAGETPAQRAAQALQIAQELGGFERGFVVWKGYDGSLAELGQSPDQELLSWAQQRVFGDEGGETDTGDAELPSGDVVKRGAYHYRVAPLTRVGQADGAIGALVLASPSGVPSLPPPDVLRSFAHALSQPS